MRQQGRHSDPIRLYPTDAGPSQRRWAEQGDDLRRATTATVSELVGGPPALELTSSCTHALEAAATVLGIGPGDEVVVPAFTFPSTANAFLLRGATIRFADVDPLTANIAPDSAQRCIGPATRAVVAVHYGGIAGDLAGLTELQRSAGWELVEDAAHGLFGSYDGVPLGRFGRLGCLSFHHTKNISSVEGGALIVNDPALSERVSIAIDKGTNRAAFTAGLTSSYEWSGQGSSWRMADPMVELLSEQLLHRDRIQARRLQVWERYHAALREWADHVGARLPVVPPGAVHPAHLFWVVLPPSAERDDVVRRCAEQGIQVVRHYGSLRESRYGHQIADPRDDCPAAAEFAHRLIRLPLHHELSEEQVERVIEAVTSNVGP